MRMVLASVKIYTDSPIPKVNQAWLACPLKQRADRKRTKKLRQQQENPAEPQLSLRPTPRFLRISAHARKEGLESPEGAKEPLVPDKAEICQPRLVSHNKGLQPRSISGPRIVK